MAEGIADWMARQVLYQETRLKVSHPVAKVAGIIRKTITHLGPEGGQLPPLRLVLATAWRTPLPSRSVGDNRRAEDGSTDG